MEASDNRYNFCYCGWMPASRLDPRRFASIQALALLKSIGSDANDNVIYMMYSPNTGNVTNYLFKSTDQGASWLLMTGFSWLHKRAIRSRGQSG